MQVIFDMKKLYGFFCLFMMNGYTDKDYDKEYPKVLDFWYDGMYKK